MENRNAGGRNTQNFVPCHERMKVSVANGLEQAMVRVAEVFGEARAVDPERDEYGHARSRACSDAVSLLKASARLIESTAKLGGSKFEHNISVRREEARIARQSEEEEDDPDPWNYQKYQGCDYDPTVSLSDGRNYVWGKGWMHVPKNWDEAGWRRGEPQPEGDPLPIFEGSNGNSGNSGPAGPRIRSLA
ncbi:MAG: hypothetical protein JO208_11475 [Alphaproteobacteria bacterium]|nr:hypothetical protein [Alphaproteobacteria bacterium]